MLRPWVWLQLVIGWLPVWALYITLIVTVHRPTSVLSAAASATVAIVPAALLGLVVHRFTKRYAWPRPFRLSFLAGHLAAALLYSLSWLALATMTEHLIHQSGAATFSSVLVPFLILGVWVYVMVAGVSYATQATERAARAEASAAQAQLAALRAQLHPHFLFNALHTVVQLIPREPARATEAAEQVAGLLRTTIEEHRDLVTLADEWDFVERYLQLERIRFGDRLTVRAEISDAAREALLPSFALQTLVENAVRHGVAPRVEPTEIAITGSVQADTLSLIVRDGGAGADPTQLDGGAGTGLRRLRERLHVLYGRRARLDLARGSTGGFTATLVIERIATDGDAS